MFGSFLLRPADARSCVSVASARLARDLRRSARDLLDHREAGSLGHKLIQLVPRPDLVEFRTIANQIGGKLLFPGKQRSRRPTINQERVGNKIVDRLDLTLECIRLHYLGETSPMAEVLDRYDDFFDLFESFKGTSSSSFCRISCPKTPQL